MARWLTVGAAMLALAACAKEPPPPPAPAAAPPPGEAGPPTDFFYVRSGSASVLEKYPRGMPVRVGAELCLESGEQITLINRAGQSVSYAGPGCARRIERSTPQNEGGFIFGWKDWGLPSQTGIVP
ncbi:MAG: hypothetical protein ACX930_13820 [Erythrobacter sp.]